MSALFAATIAVLTACGVYLLLRGRTYPVVLGLTLLSYAVNLFLFASGGLTGARAPVLGTQDSYADPLPQALVLTAIVIGFATTALYLVVMIGSRGLTDTDHVDGEEPGS